MEFKAENGVGYWRERGADTWNPFKKGGNSVLIFELSQIGQRTQNITCDKDCYVTITGSIVSGNWGTVEIKLGDEKTFSISGNWQSQTLSGTYLLPTGSIISIKTTVNAPDGDRTIYDSDGKCRSGYTSNLVITIEYV